MVKVHASLKSLLNPHCAVNSPKSLGHLVETGYSEVVDEDGCKFLQIRSKFAISSMSSMLLQIVYYFSMGRPTNLVAVSKCTI